MKQRKKHTKLKIALVSILLAVVLGEGFNYFFGNRAILSYIENNIEAVEATTDGGVTVTRDPFDGHQVITPNTDREIRVLQLTDIHLTCGFPTYFLDCSAVDAVYALVKEAKPDLIVLTGDSVSPIVFTGATGNSALIAEAIGTLFERIGIPWTIVYGNHDSEGFMSKEEMSQYYASLPHCLFEIGPSDIDGYGNHLIKLQNYDGTLNNVLFFMDSQGGFPGNYDNVHENQVAWYGETVDALEALHGKFDSVLYIHIPVAEYKTLLTRLESGDPGVEKTHGDINESIGCGANYGLYDKVVEKGSTKYIFFGHDHTNSAGLRDKEDGVILSYSLSIDFSAYPLTRFTSYQRGGNIMHFGQSEMRLEQLYIDDIQ